MASVSIVIATLNAGSLIESCLHSCLLQSYPDKRIFVVDGGSTDETLAIVGKYSDQVELLALEYDQGIYDAWNKAQCCLDSDWVLFMGADDLWLSEDSLSDFMGYANRNSFNFVSAQVYCGEHDGVAVGKKFSKYFIFCDMMVAHVGSLHKRELFIRERYDADYKIIGDYEFLRRIRMSINAGYYDAPIIRMGSNGVSRTQKKKILREVRMLCRKKWWDFVFVYPVFLARFAVSDVRAKMAGSKGPFYFGPS